MDDDSSSATISALLEMRTKCFNDLKRLQQTLKGLEDKISQTKAKLEMADEMIEAARATHKKASTPTT